MSLDTLNKALQAVALIVGGAWVVWAFLWQEHIKPRYFARPSLHIETEIKEPKKTPSHNFYPIHILISNTGKRSVKVVGAWYTVFGFDQALNGTATGTCEDMNPPKLTKIHRYYECNIFADYSGQSNPPESPRSSRLSKTPVASGIFHDQRQGYVIQPGTKISRILSFSAPDKKFLY